MTICTFFNHKQQQQQQQEVLLSCDREQTSVSPQAGELPSWSAYKSPLQHQLVLFISGLIMFFVQ